MDKKRNFIAHVDMDAFFAAIEQRDDPKLLGKPVIIGADPQKGRGRGVVSTCSYEARKFGIHSAMPISIAYKKCPRGIYLSPDMEKYAEVSEELHSIFDDFTCCVEPISIDEAFLDITGSFHLFGTPLQTCLKIKERIREQLRLTASIGLAPIKMAAKIASDLKKPDGMVEVTQEGLLEFLWPLSIRKIWGLGKKTEEALVDAGIRTIGDIAAKKPQELTKILGSNGFHFWQLANGIDDREVYDGEETKSISNETTFGEDTDDEQFILSRLLGLCEKVSLRLRREQFKGKTITLKIRLKGFKTYTRASTLSLSTNFTDTIYKEIKKLYLNFPMRDTMVRLVGVKVSNLIPSDTIETLFTDPADVNKEKVHKAVDKIKEKFGTYAIRRAGSKLRNDE
ncbi:DNA polymerase IV [Elusimicrobiota bacterium]